MSFHMLQLSAHVVVLVALHFVSQIHFVVTVPNLFTF